MHLTPRSSRRLSARPRFFWTSKPTVKKKDLLQPALNAGVHMMLGEAEGEPAHTLWHVFCGVVQRQTDSRREGSSLAGPDPQVSAPGGSFRAAYHVFSLCFFFFMPSLSCRGTGLYFQDKKSICFPAGVLLALAFVCLWAFVCPPLSGHPLSSPARRLCDAWFTGSPICCPCCPGLHGGCPASET